MLNHVGLCSRALGITRPLFMEMMQAEQQGWLESSPNPDELTKSMEQFLVSASLESSACHLGVHWLLCVLLACP